MTSKFCAFWLALTLMASPVLAADMSGSWALDKEAFRSSARVMMQAQLEEAPAELREQMGQMMEGMLDSMVEEMSGSAVFSDDGSVVFTDNGGESEKGRWEDKGDTILLFNDEGGSVEARVDGDRMIFTMQQDGMQEPFEMIWNRQ